MNTVSSALGVCLADEHALELGAFAAACGTDVAFVCLLVDEGLLQPVVMRAASPSVVLPDVLPDMQFDMPAEWRFGGEELTRVRRICRLQRDFEADLQSVAVMLELIDENERLRALLQRAGLAVP